MKKMFSILIVMILVAGMVPLVGAEFAKVEPRLRVCVDYLNKNTDVRNTEQKCRALQTEEVDCETYLESNGISNITEKCETFFRVGAKIMRERQFISSNVTENLDEWKLKRIDRYMVRRAEDTGKITDFISSLSNNDSLEFFSIGRASQRKLLEMPLGDARAWLGKRELRVIEKPTFVTRDVDEEVIANSLSRRSSARSSFTRARNSYVDNKAGFTDIKNRLIKCSGDSSVCENLRNDVLVTGKDYVGDMIEMQINYITRIREGVSASEELEDEVAQEIIIQLDEDIDMLDALNSNLKSVETRDGLTELVSDIRAEWGESRYRAYYYGVKLQAATMKNIVDRAVYMERKVDSALSALEEEGVDVSDMDADMELFSQKIEDARIVIVQAEADLINLEGVTGSGLRDESYELRLSLLNARDYLEEGSRLIGNVIDDIGKYGISLEDPDDYGLEDGEIYEVVEVGEDE
jgi:hypothetical protein